MYEQAEKFFSGGLIRLDARRYVPRFWRTMLERMVAEKFGTGTGWLIRGSDTFPTPVSNQCHSRICAVHVTVFEFVVKIMTTAARKWSNVGREVVGSCLAFLPQETQH